MRKNWFTIIIANYNGEKYLKTCLESIFKSAYKNYEVFIADDNSSDKSEEIVSNFQNKHKNLFFHKNKQNMGPSQTRNLASQKVTTEYIYFLDNDTKVSPNFLKEILSVFKNYPQAGAVQSLLADFDEQSKIQNAGLKLIPQTGWAVGIQEGEPITKRPTDPIPVIGLSASLAVKTEVIRKGVEFDKAFYHYSEDLDFSWRIWIAGYEIYLAPNSIVYHKVKKISERVNVGANNELVYFHLCKNALRSLTKNYELRNVMFYLPQCVGVLLIRALLVLIVRHDMSSLKGTFKAFVWYFGNLPDTLIQRKFVQRKLRKSADSAFMSRIMIPYGPMEIYKKHFSQTKLIPIK